MILVWRMPEVQILLIYKCSEGNRPTFQKTMKLLPGWKLKNTVKNKNGEQVPSSIPEILSPGQALVLLNTWAMSGPKLLLKLKPKNFENFIGKYMFDLDIGDLIKLFNLKRTYK